MAKAKGRKGNAAGTEQTKEQRRVGVAKPLRALYPWLEAMAINIETPALKREREARAEPRFTGDADVAARKFISASLLMKRVKAKYDTARNDLITLWAQQGLTKVNGVSIYPSVPVELFEDRMIAALTPEEASWAVKHQPVIDLDQLLILAHKDTGLQSRIAEHLTGAVKITVSPPDS